MNCEELSLRWQDHHEALLAVFENLLRSNTLVDCTLAAEGRTLKAHKVVLSACSPYFQTVFKEESEKHPIIILKDVKFWTLKAVVDFVYRGEVKIRENQLGAFLEVAESLQIKGLGTGTDEESEEKEAASNFSEQSRDVSTSPTPRKRIRRNRSSVSEGDNNVTDFNSLNNNCQYSPQHQNQSTKASNTPSTSDISIPAHGAVSNSNSSVSGTRSNDSKFEANQHSKRILPLDKSSCPENVPVIKLEPEDSKLDFSDEAADDLMEYRTVVKDMDAGLNADPIHGQSNPHVYADFAQSYVETEDQDPKHPFMSGQEVPLHSLQDLPSSNVETVDLSSDDSSFTLPQRDYSSRGAGSFANAVGPSAAHEEQQQWWQPDEAAGAWRGRRGRAAGAGGGAGGGAAAQGLLLRRLPEGVPAALRPAAPPPQAHGRAALPVRALRPHLQAARAPAHARADARPRARPRHRPAPRPRALPLPLPRPRSLSGVRPAPRARYGHVTRASLRRPALAGRRRHYRHCTLSLLAPSPALALAFPLTLTPPSSSSRSCFIVALSLILLITHVLFTRSSLLFIFVLARSPNDI